MTITLKGITSFMRKQVLGVFNLLEIEDHKPDTEESGRKVIKTKLRENIKEKLGKEENKEL